MKRIYYIATIVFAFFVLSLFIYNEGRSKDNKKVIKSGNKSYLQKYYDMPHIKEFYEWRKMEHASPPNLIYPDDLSTLSYDELRLLRNEIFARNGYLFNNGFLRGYFNRYKWYMPIFDVDTFKVELNKKELTLVNAIKKEEEKRKKNNIVKKNNLELYNAELVVNYKQFHDVPLEVRDDLKKNNFSIIPAGRAMPFWVYDKNAYQYIPHYITTDLYLFILHKYFSKSIEALDENFMSDELLSLLEEISKKMEKLEVKNSGENVTSALEWAQTYSTLALFAAGKRLAAPANKYRSIFSEEIKNIESQSGGPVFIKNNLINYNELKPRGHYTKNNKLKDYFQGFKWISLNGINLKDNEQLRGMIAFAYTVKTDTEIFKKYKQYIGIIEKLAGQEDNLSLVDLISAIPSGNLKKLLSDDSLSEIRKYLGKLNKERIRIVLGESFQTPERDIKRLYFLSSTYSISGEIFSRLVHVDLAKSKRPFPKSLDIPAVFGNNTAKNILINEYNESSSWPDYLPKLEKLQKQFSEFKNWGHNYGFKGLQTALAATAEKDNYPDFMKTDFYNRKELSTSLASWAHIKHDLILYQEKPYAAEAGQGGGPPPPEYYCYVEPNLVFWDKALELVDWLKGLIIYESTYNPQLKRIEEIGINLKDIAYKQVNGEEISDDEYRKLKYIGGTIEYIYLGLLESDHIPQRDRSMALIADVYVYNGVNLNVAVGHADDIYVLVPLKSEYYIARGAVFSFYEFKGKLYNDEEWRGLIKNKEEPKRPEWVKPIIRNVSPLKGQMQFRYPGHGMY